MKGMTSQPSNGATNYNRVKRTLPPVPTFEPSPPLTNPVTAHSTTPTTTTTHSHDDASSSYNAVAASSPISSPLPSPVESIPSSIYTLPLWSSAPSVDNWSLEVIKDGRAVENIPLKGRSHFLFGRQADVCHVTLDHPSISRRHAIFQFHENGSLWLYDLSTAHGTFRNKKRIQPNTFIQLDVGDLIQFAASSRLYLVEGPEDFRPKEIDSEMIRKRNQAAKAQYQLQQQQQHHQNNSSSVDSLHTNGASWGQSEDAVDSDDEEEGKVMVLSDDGTVATNSDTRSGVLPTKLTPQQEKMKTKLQSKQEKLSHLANEVDVLRSKELRQGGLTEGQERQISRNEERMKAISEEVANIEQQLRESVARVVGDREKNKAALANKSRRKGDSDEDYDSEDDDFYDRTKSKPPSTSSQSSATSLASSATSILSILTPIAELSTPELIAVELKRIESKRDQLRVNLQEVVISEQKTKRANSSADELESYMSTLSASALEQKKAKLKSQLQELQAHYVKLQRLAEQKKGELLKKQYLEGDKDAFKKAAASHSPSIPVPASSSASSLMSTTSPSSVSPLSSSNRPALLASGGISTADALARLKRKQEAAARREAEQQAKLDKIEEMKRAFDEQSRQFAQSNAVTPSVKPFQSDAPIDRTALLAQQMEEARHALHRDYNNLPEDDVSRALKASAQRSAASMSIGMRGDEERGGLHIRKRTTEGDPTDGDHQRSLKRSKYEPVGPPKLEEFQESESIDWVAPTNTAANQNKLREKFAGRY